jgi:hypothetical protein
MTKWKGELFKMAIPAILPVVLLGLQAWRAQGVAEEQLKSIVESNKVAHDTIQKSVDELKVNGTTLAQENSRQIANLTGVVSGLTTTVDRISRDLYRKSTTQ